MKAMVLPHGSLRSYIQSPTPIAYDTGFGTILLRIGPVFPVCICPDRLHLSLMQTSYYYLETILHPSEVTIKNK